MGINDRDYMKSIKNFPGSNYFTTVILILIIINVIIFISGSILPGGIYEGDHIDLGQRMALLFALWPIKIEEFHFWQYFSYMFLHGSLSHLLLNMFALWMFGVQVERVWGSKKLLFYYFLCGLGAGLLHSFVTFFFSNGVISQTVGASGAIMGIMVAFGFLYPEARLLFMFFLPIKAKYAVFLFAAIDLYLGLFGSDQIAHFAHLGGALVGFVLLKTNFMSEVTKSSNLRIIDLPKAYSAINIVEPKTNNSISDQLNSSEQDQLNLILDKISNSGYQNLSEDEKIFLLNIGDKLN
ncbi:MAG: rhomboid family intramembrane serine protease [Chlorobiota bacterium]|nr:MAG: rhomboid family intramembrane serine protease [Chlorobiota bacterium]